jgi:hypothetical protein
MSFYQKERGTEDAILQDMVEVSWRLTIKISHSTKKREELKMQY